MYNLIDTKLQFLKTCFQFFESHTSTITFNKTLVIYMVKAYQSYIKKPFQEHQFQVNQHHPRSKHCFLYTAKRVTGRGNYLKREGKEQRI